MKEINNSEIKEFALSLVRAETVKEVEEILKRNNFMNEDEDIWQSFGDEAASVIGNQQADPERALVEKIINSIDAVLIREAKNKYGDPCDNQSPQSMAAAIKDFFGVEDVRKAEGKKQLKQKKPGNICVSVTGEKSVPSISIVDLGEGQQPQKFTATFTRLAKSPKNKIKFVQGKFGMGGTGALRFCGNRSYNLILSKENLNNTQNTMWGVTVFRRLPIKKDERTPRYVYLKPKGEILSFHADTLDIYPTTNGPYTGEMKAGTFVKLYAYKLKKPTAVQFDTYRTLNTLVPEIALPVTIFEHRKCFDNKTAVIDGLRARFLESSGDNKPEEGFPSSGSLIISGNKLDFEIFAFQRGEKKKNIKDDYAKADAVIFMNNGQNQGSISKNKFFQSRTFKRANFDYIKDDVLVLLDCTSLPPEVQWQVFIANRETFVDSELLVRNIKKQLVHELTSHEGLELLIKRKRENLLSRGSKEMMNFAKTLLPKILDKTTIHELLNPGGEIPFGPVGPDTGVGKQEEFKGKKFPTIFEIQGKEKRELAENGKNLIFTFNTDVENDYFSRSRAKGIVAWTQDNADKFNLSHRLWNGKFKITIIPKKGRIVLGEEYKFKLNISDETQTMPFTLNFTVNVVGKKPPPPHPIPNPNPVPRPPKGRGGKDWPDLTPVRKSDWGEHEFNEESAIRIIDRGDNKYDYFINMDNRYLQNQIKDDPDSKPFSEQQYKLSMMLITLALIRKKDMEKDTKNDMEKNREELSIEEMVSNCTSSVSCIIFPIINRLSKKGALNIDS